MPNVQRQGPHSARQTRRPRQRRKDRDAVNELVMTGATLDEVRPLLAQEHYLGNRCPDPMHVFAWRKAGGLFGHTGEIVAAVVYAAPANKYFGQGSTELVRLVRTNDVSEPLSKFVSWSLRWLKRNTSIKYCVSYA